jgi:hypothetical protein
VCSYTNVGDDDNQEEPEQAGDADVLDEAGQVPCPRANAPLTQSEKKRKGKTCYHQSMACGIHFLAEIRRKKEERRNPSTTPEC